MSRTQDHVIFIARSSVDQYPMNGPRRESDVSLRISLEYTKSCYEEVYGPIRGIFEFHTFAWPSFIELPLSGDTVQFFAERTSALEIENKRMIVVINGWDGLTSHAGSFNILFRQHAPRITLRVFADQPRSFYQVNVEQVLKLFDGHILINPYLEGLPHEPLEEGLLAELKRMESELEYSTALFYRYFRAYGILQLN